MDTLGLSLSLTGLETAPLQAMMAKVRDFQNETGQAASASGERGNPQVGIIALGYLPKILAGSPALTLEIPPAKTNHGRLGARIEARLAPGTNGAHDRASQPVAGFLQRLAVKGHAFTERKLANWLIARSNEPEQARQTLQQLISQNLLVADEDRIRARLHADVDALRINGRRMPPAMRQAMLSGLLAGALGLAATP